MNMSLTSGGHYVEVEDGHHVRTDDLNLAGSHDVLEEVDPMHALAREGGGSDGCDGGAAQEDHWKNVSDGAERWR